MSEQEKKSGNAGGSSVVLVEQSGASRHKQPFRPTELQEEASELHHKRSRAPAVPSAVEEELKDKTHIDTKAPIECDHAMSSEKQKHHMAKKLSSSTKKRASSPESITLGPIEIATKKGSMTRPPQPIPDTSTSDTDVDTKLSVQREEQDSVDDEIAELRTPKVAKKTSEWIDDSKDLKEKDVSWNDSEYLDKVKIQETGIKSRVCILERKRSIGPCFRSSAPYGRPSGIAICLPNKYASPPAYTDSNQSQSIINITVSKKCLLNKVISQGSKVKEQVIQKQNLPDVKFFGTLKAKFLDMTVKIKQVLNA